MSWVCGLEASKDPLPFGGSMAGSHFISESELHQPPVVTERGSHFFWKKPHICPDELWRGLGMRCSLLGGPSASSGTARILSWNTGVSC